MNLSKISSKCRILTSQLAQTQERENVILSRLAELSVTFVKVHLNISQIGVIEREVSELDHAKNFPWHPAGSHLRRIFVPKF